MMEYNISFLIAALIFLLLQYYHFVLQRRLDDMKNRVFRFFFLIGFSDVFLDMVCTLLIEEENAEYVWITRILMTTFYLIQVLVPYAFAGYVISLREEDDNIGKSLIRWSVPALAMAVLVLTNLDHGLLFTIDKNGNYIHGVGYLWMYYYVFVYILLAIIHCFLHYKEIGREKITVICEFLVVAAVCVTIQAVNGKLLVTGFGVALGISILFFTIQNPYNDVDNLTGTLDKQYFEKWIREKGRKNSCYHLIAVDIDLRKVNKFWGTKTGDKLLIQISKEMQIISNLSHVFRLTSKRFVVVLDYLVDYEYVRDSLMEFFENEILIDGESVAVPAVVCGIVDLQNWTEMDKLVAYIDYLVDRLPDVEMATLIQGDEKTLHGFLFEQEVEQFLNIAIEKDLFEVHYQPVFDMETQKFISIEALSRLRHPSLGNIPPDVFIGIAEKNGLITQIGQLQFRKICRFMKEHPQMMEVIKNVKVNLSPSELVHSDYSRILIGIIKEYDLPFSFFQFEITETVATEYSEVLYQSVNDFVKAGIGLCLDDFGSGYANLDSVLRLPFYCIKIDKSLLRGICNSEQSAKFYSNIVAVMRNMGYLVVAEGVETKMEVDLLSKWNVNMIQGYYYSKPLNETDTLEKLLGKEA